MARWLVILILFTSVFLLLVSCDIYESEEKDWENDVTVHIINETICPVDIRLNGADKDTANPGETLELEDIGQGVFYLEAYPWNDDFHACNGIYTDELKNGDLFIWTIDLDNPCATCDPTPQPTIVPLPTAEG